MHPAFLPQEIGTRIRVTVCYDDLMTFLCRHGFFPERTDGSSATMYRQFPDFYLCADAEPAWRADWANFIVQL